MLPQKNRPVFFLPYQSESGFSASGGRLNAAARTHVWRQSVRKTIRHQPKALRFIPWSAEAASTPKGYMPCDPDHEDNSQDSPITPVSNIAPSPRSAGLIDPFGSLPVPGLTRDDEFILNYAFHRTIQPVFGESELANQAFVKSWMLRTMRSPMVLNAQISGASTHYLIASSDDPSANRRILSRGLQRKINAIQALRTQIDQYQPGLLDADNDLLLTIFILGIHEGLPRSDWRRPHPLSPLATHRDLHLYGRMVFGDQHINALYRLIEQRGGLSFVDQSIFGCVLPPWDLMNSCRTGLPPRFPCPPHPKSLLQRGIWDPDQEALRMLATLGRCFRPDSIDGTRPVFLHVEMEEPLQVMADITVALDHFCRKTPGAPASLNMLLGNCDWAAHKILSIAPYSLKEPTVPGVDPEKEQDADAITVLYEICRLCALIYMDMTIFIMPPHTGIKPRLSKEMLGLIEATWQASHSTDSRVADFLTWATVVGAIAARFTEAEGQYLNQIKKVACDSDWETIYPRLQGFLWFGQVCDGPGVALWREACTAGGSGEALLT